MSIYGHADISKEALQHWACAQSTEQLNYIDIGGTHFEITDGLKEALNLQLSIFRELVNKLTPGDDWRTCLYSVNEFFYNAFIRIDNSSIKIGDFYECLIVSSNIKTYKKIIKGFRYNEIGAIFIKDAAGTLIANIGQKSDLIWQTFYDYFVNSNDDGSVNHTYENHEQYLSIQLYHVETLSISEIKNRVNEILLRVSMEYDMDFTIFSVDPLFKAEGDASPHELEYTPTGFEQIPALYLTSAINSSNVRLAYLCYYQVIEYFFVRAQNNYFLSSLPSHNLDGISHGNLRKALDMYKNVSKEKPALKLVLSNSINVNSFKEWMNNTPTLYEIYRNSESNKIDISKSDKAIIVQLVDRVYAYRCSIAHAKGDIDEFIAIPSLSDEKIAKELPLLKYLAFSTIQHYSQL